MSFFYALKTLKNTQNSFFKMFFLSNRKKIQLTITFSFVFL
ncbi:hypothetical protein FEM21_04460 [Flavobacterium seoulense]|uniref:Uncharacterized protein n=1 Tax=Flavobacterium seoulense TaxID=1492738 RepID=A0A066WQV7_9FLAO|nr:hypothetical protein FEM21_04460 [Flavobacterium seoulense]